MTLNNQILKTTGTDEIVVDVEVEHEEALHGVAIIEGQKVRVMKYWKTDEKWYLAVGEWIR